MVIYKASQSIQNNKATLSNTIIPTIGADLYFSVGGGGGGGVEGGREGGAKNLIAIANSGCPRHMIERGLADGSKGIFYTFFIIVVI